MEERLGLGGSRTHLGQNFAPSTCNQLGREQPAGFMEEMKGYLRMKDGEFCSH